MNKTPWFAVFVGLLTSVFLLSVIELFRISFSGSAYVAISYLREFWGLSIATFSFLLFQMRKPSSKFEKALSGVGLSAIYLLLSFALIEERTIVQNFAIQILLVLGFLSSFFVGYIWKRSEKIEALLSLGSFAFAVFFLIADLFVFPEQYFGVHELFLSTAFVALWISIRFYYLVAGPKVRWVLNGTSIGALGLVFFAYFSNQESIAEYRADSQLGKAVSTVALEREYKAVAGEFFSSKPVELFKKKSGFQTFDGDLEDYNIVFVLSETTRADETFLNNEKVNFTPNLKKLSKKSTVYENAIAPSSGTFQSVASVFSMVPPSMSPIDLWSKHWVGELRKERFSVVESFNNSGWDTAWIGHDYHRFFSHDKVRGFDRGFNHKKLEPETKPRHSKKSDARTAKRAVKYIKKKAKADERFFLFTFFSAPHASYVKHFKEMPGKTQRERYRQEVRFVDSQFGKLVKAIKESGIEKKTIIIFAGDHGEAFGEHRTNRHNSQLYRESVHVPLAVFIPGEDASRISKPVSLFSLFPNLMLSGPREMKKEVSQVVKDDLAPLHVAMGEGALSELIRLKKKLTRIDLDDRVLIYDHVADRIYRFEDEGERKVLSPTKEDEEIIDRLGRLRSTRKRYTKKVNYSPWKRFKKKK